MLADSNGQSGVVQAFEGRETGGFRQRWKFARHQTILIGISEPRGGIGSSRASPSGGCVNSPRLEWSERIGCL